MTYSFGRIDCVQLIWFCAVSCAYVVALRSKLLSLCRQTHVVSPAVVLQATYCLGS